MRKQIPKDAFFSKFGIRGKDRATFDNQIHAIIIRAHISPDTVNLEAGHDVPSIYVIELQMNVHECDINNIKLLEKMGHKTVYLLTYGSESCVAVYDMLGFKTEWSKTECSLELTGLNLDEAWINIFRSIGNLPSDVPLDFAIIECIRIKMLQKEIERLEKKIKKSKQNHEIRELDAKIRELKKQMVPRKPEDAQTASSEDSVPRHQGVNVMTRVRSVTQPRGGYINPKTLECTAFDDGLALGPENIHPTTIGLAVDYLSRMMMGDDRDEAFKISMRGAIIAGKLNQASTYLSNITGLDDASIISACHLVMFDSYARARCAPSIDPSEVTADSQTCQNIRTMVNRCMKFFSEHGPIVNSAPTFGKGYTDVISTGDGDYLTEDTFWDLKVSKNPPTKDNTLQLAIYYLMGKHSGISDYDTITDIGIFNPRLNTMYTLDMRLVPADIISTISKDVIGYSE